ncbi:TPA: MFS transporter [Providencia rettgeri]
MVKTLRWRLVSMLFILGIINYLDRSALSVAAPLITEDLGLTPTQLGFVFSIFFIGYAPFCFIGGYAADKYGPRLIIIIITAAWSLFCGLTAIAYSLGILLGLRLLFGMAEGPFNTSMAKFVSNWFPRSEQASAIGIANAGTPLGGAISGPIVGFIAVSFGWRISFIIIALLGFVWLFFWYRKSKDKPAQHPTITQNELDFITQEQPPETAAAKYSLGFYLRQPAILSVAFAFFSYSYILYFFLSWFPSYLTMVQHLDITTMGMINTIPWSLGFIGLAAGGFICDSLGKKINNHIRAKKMVMIFSLLFAAISIILTGIISSVTLAVAMMALATFFVYLSGSTYWAIILELVEPSRVGGVGGFTHLVANCAGVLAPIVTGFIVEKSGGFTGAFAISGIIAIVGSLLVLFLVKTNKAALTNTLS